MAGQAERLTLTTEIVAAHVGRNPVAVGQIPALIREVHQTLAGLGSEDPDLTPVLPINESVRKATIICLECGRSGKMLKRHLSVAHGLSIKEYWQRWKLSGGLSDGGTELRRRVPRVGQEDRVGEEGEETRPEEGVTTAGRAVGTPWSQSGRHTSLPPS